MASNAIPFACALVFVLVVSPSTCENWFTKSLDSFGFENCSFLDHSNVLGDFHTCLNSPPASPGQSKFKREIRDKFSGGSKSEPAADTTLMWPESECKELESFEACFVAFDDVPCLTDSEVLFFEQNREFFRLRKEFVCANASEISPILLNSTCAHKNHIDAGQICFSQTQPRYIWVGWPLNYDDGQMCSFVRGLRDCETKSYKDCPEEVYQYVLDTWNAGFPPTNCAIEDEEVADPNASTAFYDKYVNNDYNFNANGQQAEQYNPMSKGRKAKDSKSDHKFL